jgi:hypothetical protein
MSYIKPKNLNYVFQSFCLLLFLSFCLSVFFSFCLFVFQSFCLFLFLSFCLSVFLSFCLSVFLSFCLSVFLSFVSFCLLKITVVRLHLSLKNNKTRLLRNLIIMKLDSNGWFGLGQGWLRGHSKNTVQMGGGRGGYCKMTQNVTVGEGGNG